MKENLIGMFDSGLGGLSVLKALMAMVPDVPAFFSRINGTARTAPCLTSSLSTGAGPPATGSPRRIPRKSPFWQPPQRGGQKSRSYR